MQFGGHAQQHSLPGIEQGPGEAWVLFRPEEPMATPPVKPQVEELHWVWVEVTGGVPWQRRVEGMSHVVPGYPTASSGR